MKRPDKKNYHEGHPQMDEGTELYRYVYDLNEYIDYLEKIFTTHVNDVEILLESSSKERYKTDERRIGFQQGAKWMRSKIGL